MHFPSVSVITSGPAIGHGIQIDQTTLDLVTEHANSVAPVKVFPDHEETVRDLIGAMRNFRVEGDQVKADLDLIEEHPLSAYYAKILELFPETLGFSISWEGSVEKIGEEECCRPTAILSVDLVSRAAANPGGVFSARTAPRNAAAKPQMPPATQHALDGGQVDNAQEVTMPETNPAAESSVEELIAKALAPVMEAVKALNDKLDAFVAADPAQDKEMIDEALKNSGELSAKLDVVAAKLSVLEEAGRGAQALDAAPESEDLVTRFNAITGDRDKAAFAMRHPELRKLLK